jgi:hypothetical protein
MNARSSPQAPRRHPQQFQQVAPEVLYVFRRYRIVWWALLSLIACGMLSRPQPPGIDYEALVDWGLTENSPPQAAGL